MWLGSGLPKMMLTNKIKMVMQLMVTLASSKLSDNAWTLLTIISISHLRQIKMARILDTAPIYASEPEYSTPQIIRIINCAAKKDTWWITTGNFSKIEVFFLCHTHIWLFRFNKWVRNYNRIYLDKFYPIYEILQLGVIYWE